MKHIRRSLWASGFSLLLCLVLLAGTTLAWFTDSVTNRGNIITAGNLSIDATFYDVDKTATSGTAYRFDDVNNGQNFYFKTTGQSLKEDTCPPIINESLWEPGKSNAKLLEVVNNGTLAAKIKLQFNVTDNGLMNALWFDFVQVDADGDVIGSFQERPMSDLATFAKDLELSLAANGGTVRFILVYGMYEEASNVYMNKSFSADVTILATQDTVEEDGFGNDQYDDGATYPVASDAQLQEALEQATEGDTILLSSGAFRLADGTKIPQGVTIAGNGVDETTITVPETESSSKRIVGLVIDQPGVTIKDATIKPAAGISSDEYAGIVVVKEGGTVLENVNIVSNTYTSPILVADSTFGQGDTLTIKNSTIQAKFRALFIVDGTNGKVIIDNCDITGVYPFNVNSANSQNLEMEVRDSALHGWTSYGRIKDASFTNTEFSQGGSAYNFLRPYANTTWTGCTFGEGFLIGAGAADLTYTFTDCQYADGTAVTAANINDLLDSSGGDSYLLQCTVTVDGTPVTVTAD